MSNSRARIRAAGFDSSGQKLATRLDVWPAEFTGGLPVLASTGKQAAKNIIHFFWSVWFKICYFDTPDLVDGSLRPVEELF